MDRIVALNTGNCFDLIILLQIMHSGQDEDEFHHITRDCYGSYSDGVGCYRVEKFQSPFGEVRRPFPPICWAKPLIEHIDIRSGDLGESSYLEFCCCFSDF